MRSTYLILMWMSQLCYLTAAVLIPIYVTPGWYWWSGFFIVTLFATGSKMGDRIDEWNQMDRLNSIN